MCLAVPGKVLEIVDRARTIAEVEVAGARRNVNIELLQGQDEPAPGDYVLVHLGCALSRIDEGEAMELLRMLEALRQDSADDAGGLEQSGVS
ncbi:MAG: HypC/HybG/HupF family hydrogenase formation chaperone [Candidatus Dormibacteraeota bacterium]|nr:HypC/HybG/HupF family hydrogenase formation chaperone [Candidatus Dormibacteraeota bacterium]